MTVTWRTGDALDLMRAMPSGSVDAVICSPPFLALRDYGGLAGQWGSEPDPAEFLDHLLELAVELRRVLAPHGSLALELGDTYSGSGGAGGDYADGGWRDGQARPDGSARRTRPDGNGKVFRGGKRGPDKLGSGWPLPKSLCLIPTLFPACLAYGRNLLDPMAEPFEPWRVRNLIVWARNNPPVGALGDKVRPATSYITVACPGRSRWFDLDAVRAPMRGHSLRYWHAGSLPAKGANPSRKDGGGLDGSRPPNPAGSPPLDHWWDEPDGDLAWLINTQGSNLSHYAMWPPKLAERLVLSMVPAEVCRVCGEPRRRLVERDRRTDGNYGRPNAFGRSERNGRDFASNAETSYITLGWSDCHHDYRPGIVCDPFAGTGTTLAVADIHGRDAIGFDLDLANRDLYERRYEQCWKALGKGGASPVTEHGRQQALAI